MCVGEPFWNPASASGFLLDWDGVIAETNLDFSGLRQKYFGGRPAMLLEEAGSLPDGLRESMLAEMAEIETEGARRAVPVPGAFELLAKLEERKIPFCILSRNSGEIIRIGAEAIGLTLPAFTWGRDDMKWVKPDPRALLEASRAMGADARRCVYVGDFLYDLEGARRAGMRAVLVQREEPAWDCWCDAAYPKLTDLVAALDDTTPLVPWEYREIYARKGEKWMNRVSQMIFALPETPSPTADCWLARAAALGVGAFYIDPERVFSPDDWKRNPSFDTGAMGRKWADVARDFLAPRYPLARVVTERTEDVINAPKNSLDLMRFIERRKTVRARA